MEQNLLGSMIRQELTNILMRKPTAPAKPPIENEAKLDENIRKRERRKAINHRYYVKCKLDNYMKGIINRFQLLDDKRKKEIIKQLKIIRANC